MITKYGICKFEIKTINSPDYEDLEILKEADSLEELSNILNSDESTYSCKIIVGGKIPECLEHHVQMVKISQRSQFLGNMIPLWKCPICDYTEYRNED